MTYIKVTTDLFNYKAIRDVVQCARVDGHKLELIEGPGFWRRKFRIEGDAVAVRMVHARLKDWATNAGSDWTERVDAAPSHFR